MTALLVGLALLVLVFVAHGVRQFVRNGIRMDPRVRRLLAFCAAGFASGLAGLLTGWFWFLPLAVVLVVAAVWPEMRGLQQVNDELASAAASWVHPVDRAAAEDSSVSPEPVDLLDEAAEAESVAS